MGFLENISASQEQFSVVTYAVFLRDAGREILEVRTTPQLTQALTARIAGEASRAAELVVVPFEPALEPIAGHALELAVGESAEAQELWAQVKKNDVGLLSDFDELRAAEYVVYAVSTRGGELSLFVQATPRAGWVKPKGGLLAAVTGTALDVAKPETLFEFPTKFALVMSANRILILDQRSAAKFLGLDAVTRQKAREMAADLVSDLRIDGLDDFLETVSSDANMHSKLRSAQRKMAESPAYKQAMTTDHLVKFIATREDITLEVRESEDGPILVHDSSPKGRWMILKLLDDDYLMSTLTQEQYEANSKQTVRTER